MTIAKPAVRPTVPHFSSGPCAKRPGWSPQALNGAVLGRSHRSKIGKAQAQARHRSHPRGAAGPRRLSHRHRAGLRYRRRRNGAVVAARPAPGDRCWPGNPSAKAGSSDVAKELKLKDVTVLKAGYGELPDLSKVDPASDIVFTWNGTTSGVRVANADWIAADRAGLAICDATSAAFAQPLDWGKLDVVTFSWQKALGGEAAHGMLILSPRAVARLESYTPPWPLPKIFRMTKGGKLIEGIFQGETINTPSMLCVEDYLDALEWAKSIGGLIGAARPRRRQCPGHRRLGRARGVDRFSRPRAGVALQHLGLPEGRRSGRQPALRPRRRRHSSKASPRRWRRKASPTTSTPIAMRRRGCASGAVRPSSAPTSRRSRSGSTGPMPRPRMRWRKAA